MATKCVHPDLSSLSSQSLDPAFVRRRALRRARHSPAVRSRSVVPALPLVDPFRFTVHASGLDCSVAYVRAYRPGNGKENAVCENLHARPAHDLPHRCASVCSFRAGRLCPFGDGARPTLANAHRLSCLHRPARGLPAARAPDRAGPGMTLRRGQRRQAVASRWLATSRRGPATAPTREGTGRQLRSAIFALRAYR